MKKRLKLGDLVGIGVGSMIGGGIFVASGLAISQAGPWAIFSFILATAIALMTGCTYAKLCMKYPSAGGSYSFLRAKLPIPLSEAFGKLLLFGYLAAISLYGATFGVYLAQFIRLDHRLLGSFLIALMGLLNALGVKENSKVVNGLVILKVSILIFVALASLTLLKPENFYFDGYLGLLKALPPISFIFIGFQGFEIIVNAVEETYDKRDIVKAIYLSITSVAIVYLLIVTVTIGALGSRPIHEERALFDLAVRSLGNLGGALITLSAIISTASATNGAIFGSSRVLYSMSRNNSSYRGFIYLHPKRGTPVLAITAISALSLILLWLLPLRSVASVPSLIFLIAFLLVNLAGYKEGYKYSLLPALIIAYFITFSEPTSLAITLGVLTFLTFIEFLKYK
ncbi:MAG: hypothetical protein B6U69_03335 [Thermofilum sp. ex4484_15]|nr:MAG: hypothetical protein B6U69_03335 [Thermofilum sp. ex4484_15]